MLTCSSKSDPFGNDVTQIGQLNVISVSISWVEEDSGGKDGEVKSKCWRLICSSSLKGLFDLKGHIGHSWTGSFGAACEFSVRLRLDRNGEPWPAELSGTNIKYS